MLIIETPYGNFGKFEDVLQFVKEENLAEIQMTVKYNFCQVGLRSMFYTYQDIERILNGKGMEDKEDDNV